MGRTFKIALHEAIFLLSPSGNGRKTLAFSPQNGIFAWLRPAERDLRCASTSEDFSLIIFTA